MLRFILDQILELLQRQCDHPPRNSPSRRRDRKEHAMTPEQIPTIEDIRDAVDGRNDMIHAVYQYQCERCRSVELIGLGCGVEGPKTGATMHAWIPSPFMCRCTVCGGTMAHTRWQQDEHFALRDAPRRGRYFKVPKDGPDPKRYQSSMFAGEMGNEGRPILLGGRA